MNTIIFGIPTPKRRRKHCHRGSQARFEKRGGDFGQSNSRLLRDILRRKPSPLTPLSTSWLD
jgi:hypothetical protein